ncbi:hypothetical protein SAMN04487944_10377 [Gracilibacillus ureilyticus]|uniref:Uncharacterized protein n=1 Tax=Gracilibacillus ureilyticus TaxID=531814 RepID=A0A1H9NCH1_9BACI|nr:hypothetical protein [Gracilibacillus ureilyticus]SER33730.1 hypothetical protein SAMN04487944_10377 [Gracilibacillus ureilyticus]
MKSNSNFKQVIECYAAILFICIIFFGSVYIAGEISGANDTLSKLPGFSWDMINTWSEIIK